MTRFYTLCYLTQGGRTLMLNRQKRQDINKDFQRGVYNAPGGKVEEGESFLESILREYQEETGLQLVKLQLQGVLITTLEGEKRIVGVYTATESKGDLRGNGREGEPAWIANKTIPQLPRWRSDRYLWPLVQERRPFTLTLTYTGERTIEGEPAVAFRSRENLQRLLSYERVLDRIANARRVTIHNGTFLSRLFPRQYRGARAAAHLEERMHEISAVRTPFDNAWNWRETAGRVELWHVDPNGRDGAEVTRYVVRYRR